MSKAIALSSIILSLMLLASAAEAGGAGTKQAFEIKGIYLGMPLSDFKKLRPYPKMLCSDRLDHIDPDVAFIGQTKCHTRDGDTIAKEKVFIVFNFLTEDMVSWENDRLYESVISFEHGSYGTIKSAFLNKFGAPTNLEKQIYTNAMGARVEGEILTWSNATGEMKILEYASKLTRSLIFIKHRTLSAEFQKRKIQKEGDRDSDI